MNVGTRKQLARLMSAADGNHNLPVATMNAAHTLNDIYDGWGNMSAEQCSQAADRLRYLADMLDGRDTAGGNQHTYSY